jgi:hypothetical protein
VRADPFVGREWGGRSRPAPFEMTVWGWDEKEGKKSACSVRNDVSEYEGFEPEIKSGIRVAELDRSTEDLGIRLGLLFWSGARP